MVSFGDIEGHTIQKYPPWCARLLRSTKILPRLERLPVFLARQIFDWGAILGRSGAVPHIIRKSATLVTKQGTRMRYRTWEVSGGDITAPGVLFFHGGGWTLGNSRSHDDFCALLATTACVKVYAIDYRLAPESPYPAALHDAEEAWEWLRALTERNAPLHARGLVVCGDSAGGNLAAALCLKLRDRGGSLPLAQFLIYPVLDLAQAGESYQKYSQGYLLTREMMAWFISQYDPSRRFLTGKSLARDPYAAPLLADSFADLPSTYLFLAERDILLDQGRVYADFLANGGTPVQLEVFPDMIHGFINLMKYPEAFAAGHSIANSMRLFCSDLEIPNDITKSA